MLKQTTDTRATKGATRNTPFRLRQKDWLPYALTAPAVLLVATIVVYPLLTAMRASLFDMNLLRLDQATFVGLQNYQALLQDDIFVGSLIRTVRWTVLIVALQMVIGLPVALLLNHTFRWRGLVRTVVLVPYIVPSAVIAVIWVYMFDANFGVMNEIFVRLGLISTYKAWIADTTGSFLVLVYAMVWWGMPFMAIMLLAALQTLEQDLYEAARIDGAGAWQSFRYITLPQLMPTILLLLLLRTMWMAHHVDTIFLITDGGPGVANHTIPVYSFLLASVRFEMGYASAVAVVLGLILLVLALIYTKRIEKSMDYLQ